MLRLGEDDLRDMRIWWWIRNKICRECVSWQDSVLIKPELHWPDGEEYRVRIDGWKKRGEAIRVTWLPGMARPLYQRGAKVPCLQAFFDMKKPREKPTRFLQPRRRARGVAWSEIERQDGSRAFVQERSLERATEAIPGIEFRVATFRGTLMLFGYSRGLRALITAVEELPT